MVKSPIYFLSSQKLSTFENYYGNFYQFIYFYSQPILDNMIEYEYNYIPHIPGTFYLSQGEAQCFQLHYHNLCTQA